MLLLRAAAHPPGPWSITHDLLDRAGAVVAHCSGLNPLADPIPDHHPGPPLVFRSGPPGEGVIPWGAAARSAWLHASDRLAALGPAWVHPRAGDVLSDAPGVLSFLNQRPRFGLFLEPAALLAPAMLPQAPEHLARIAAALLPRASAVLLTGVRPESDRLHRAPLGEGPINSHDLLAPIAHALEGMTDLPPLALLEPAEAQRRVLERAGLVP